MPGFLRINHDNAQKANLQGWLFAGTVPFGFIAVRVFVLGRTLPWAQSRGNVPFALGREKARWGGVPAHRGPASGTLTTATTDNGPVWEDCVFSHWASSSGNTAPTKGHAAEISVQDKSMDRKHLGRKRLLDSFFSTSFFLPLKPEVSVDVVTFNLIYFLNLPVSYRGFAYPTAQRF